MITPVKNLEMDPVGLRPSHPGAEGLAAVQKRNACGHEQQASQGRTFLEHILELEADYLTVRQALQTVADEPTELKRETWLLPNPADVRQRPPAGTLPDLRSYIQEREEFSRQAAPAFDAAAASQPSVEDQADRIRFAQQYLPFTGILPASPAQSGKTVVTRDDEDELEAPRRRLPAWLPGVAIAAFVALCLLVLLL